MKLVRHVRLYIQPYIGSLLVSLGGKVTNHVDQNFLAACLNIDGGQMAQILGNGRELVVTPEAVALQSLAVLQCLITLHHIVAIMAELAGAASAYICSGTECQGQGRLGQSGLTQPDQGHQHQMPACRVACQDNILGGDATFEQIAVGV